MKWCCRSIEVTIVYGAEEAQNHHMRTPLPECADAHVHENCPSLVTQHENCIPGQDDWHPPPSPSGLAQLHLSPTDYPTFGFPTDGYIGAVRQRNNVRQEPVDWVEFWRKYRLGDQLRHLRRTYPGRALACLSAAQSCHSQNIARAEYETHYNYISNLQSHTIVHEKSMTAMRITKRWI